MVVGGVLFKMILMGVGGDFLVYFWCVCVCFYGLFLTWPLMYS